MTDLKPEVNKAGVDEKNQYGLHRTFSSTQAESLRDESAVTPVISLHGEPLDTGDPTHGTYHNLYAIIIVVTAFVDVESVMLAIELESKPFPIV